MESTQNKNGNAFQGDVLPADTGAALQKLIKLSTQLLSLADRETQSLIQGDTVTFAILQQEKELLSRHYARASQEFRGRLEEFRGAERGLIDRLEILQKQLDEKSRGNNVIVEQMYHRSKERTQSTLITAQELGQQVPVRANEQNEQREGV